MSEKRRCIWCIPNDMPMILCDDEATDYFIVNIIAAWCEMSNFMNFVQIIIDSVDRIYDSFGSAEISNLIRLWFRAVFICFIRMVFQIDTLKWTYSEHMRSAKQTYSLSFPAAVVSVFASSPVSLSNAKFFSPLHTHTLTHTVTLTHKHTHAHIQMCTNTRARSHTYACTAFVVRTKFTDDCTAILLQTHTVHMHPCECISDCFGCFRFSLVLPSFVLC